MMKGAAYVIAIRPALLKFERRQNVKKSVMLLNVAGMMVNV